MIVLDTETTGLSPKESAIVSIGAIDTETLKTFYEECRIFEGAKVEPRALEVNGFTMDQIIDPIKKSLETVLHNVIDFIDHSPDKTIAGANPEFDRSFIQEGINRCKIMDTKYNKPLHFGGGMSLDLLSSMLYHYKQKNIVPPMKNGRVSINADTVFKYVGIFSDRKIHNALTDAKMEAEAFSRLIYGRKMLDEFMQFPILYRVLEESDKNSPYHFH